jgi:electron transfer flavoprotein alpha subunit
MKKDILVFVDHFQGDVQPASWEALGVAQSLAGDGTISALVIGDNRTELAESAFHYGADQVLLAEHPTLADYRPDPWADTFVQAARAYEPDLILVPTTIRGRELAGMISVDLETGVLVDVIDLKVEGDDIIATRPIYAGKLLSDLTCSATPQIITLRGRAFEAPKPDSGRSGEIHALDLDLDPEEIRTQVVEYVESEEGVSLKDASVIVSGGRGVTNNPELTPPTDLDEEEQDIWKAQQGFKLIQELASVLDAAVGASRAAVDAGYIPYENQVGQTGKVVSPELYIACGISGAIQHLAGMRTSKVIVAVNKDPNAPIFKLARFGVLGDLYDILPPLTKAFQEELGT